MIDVVLQSTGDWGRKRQFSDNVYLMSFRNASPRNQFSIWRPPYLSTERSAPTGCTQIYALDHGPQHAIAPIFIAYSYRMETRRYNPTLLFVLALLFWLNWGTGNQPDVATEDGFSHVLKSLNRTVTPSLYPQNITDWYKGASQSN